jgi:UDP-glucuronate decarboxylase
MLKKRVLVTGGAGFIGTHLCRALLDKGYEVLCLDNFFTGRKDNIMHLLKNPYFELIRHDVTQPLNFEVDEIYNLACPASPVYYQSDPVQTVRTNVLGAINVLDLAKRTGATVLQASTSEVYGDPQIDVQPESYWGNVNPIGIRSCYDEGKRCAETLFFDYHREHKVQIRVARIFNTYGPWMRADDGRVVSNFITQALNKKKITIYGQGTQTRSFCFVSDMVKGLILLMEAGDKITTPINLGNPSPISMLSLAERLSKLLGKDVDLEHKPLPQDDPKKRHPDISLAKQHLGWSPIVSLDDGLIQTIDYFKSAMLIPAL